MGITYSCQDLKGTVDCCSEKVETGIEEAKEAVTDLAEVVIDATDRIDPSAIGDGVVAAIEAAQEGVTDLGAAAKDQVLSAGDAAVAAVKEGAEDVCATIDAAVTAVTGLVTVEFVTEQGAVKEVQFTSRAAGFVLGMSGGGCCRRAVQPRVVVKKLEKQGQGEMLGVKRGWEMKSVAGTVVTGLKQAQELLTDKFMPLPEA